MEIKDRIRMIMEREKVPPRVFAETIGVQQSTLSHILNDRNKPSLEVVMKVHQKYDYVNLEWLLYGKGEMMVSEEGTSFSSSNHDYLPSLFDENPVNPSKEPTLPENRKEMPLRNAENSPKEIVKQEIRYIEKPAAEKFGSRLCKNLSIHDAEIPCAFAGLRKVHQQAWQYWQGSA